MATILWKDGNSQKFEADTVQRMIQGGWTFTNEPPEIKAPTKNEADLNQSGILNSTEIRAAARDAGIRNWHNKKIENLRKELGYDED